jgi:16S rRNA (cytosine967-C5)-methyltransferase
MPSIDDPRRQAALAVADVLGGHSLDPSLRQRMRELSQRDQALCQELATGTIRHFYSLSHAVRARFDHPSREPDTDVMALLLVGAYQLRRMRIPAHAAVHATAEAAKGLGKRWAVGLINAVLRRLQRESGDEAGEDEEVRFDHPRWMIETLRQEMPEDFERVLRCNLTRAPMTLRINRRHTSREAYLQRLNEAGVSAHPGRLAESAIVLEAPRPVESLPGADGVDFVIQDEGAQIAAPLLLRGGAERILDACAAPGGKALHLAELAPNAELTLIDADPERADVLRQRFARRDTVCEILNADASTPSQWWDGELFDRILLDAPCTASGAVRRHPDIRLLRRQADADNLAANQRQLLCGLWPTLKPDGLLLYCTCSLFYAENDGVISAFLEQTPDAAIESVPPEAGFETAAGRQLLPVEGANDGFFFSLLRKRR